MRYPLDIPGGFHLDTVRDSDEEALVEHLAEPEIIRGTLTIPSPYTREHARAAIAYQRETNLARGAPVGFVIRSGEGRLIGMIGLHPEQGPGSHRAELGYWLARPYWGKGIATAAVRTLVAHAFTALGLRRLVAQAYPWNERSIRVLHKCGFRREGLLRGHVLKDDEPVDVVAFGLLADEAGPRVKESG